ncbi:MAG: HAD family hydrolase [Acidimicrobiia bacterium]|jgi:putative hydrolase of the HAD superfamily
MPVDPATSPSGLPEAVVFDFDGLLIDSEWAIFETAVAAFAAHGHTLSTEAWATIIGTSADDDPTWWATVCQAAGITGFSQADFETAYEAQPRDRNDIPLLPGAVELLDELGAAGVPVGVASSSSRAWLQRHTARHGLTERFATLVGSDVVGGVGKPAPDVYLKACADLGADPRRSVALEDSAHGTTAAKAAGMAVVAVPSRLTVHNDFSHADLVVDSLVGLSLDQLRALVA